MKKQFLFLGTVMFGVFSVFAQTPYDNFAPEQSVKSMIELPPKQFKVTNVNLDSEIRYIEFDKSTLSLTLLDDNENVIKTLVFNPTEKKFLTIDPHAENYYSTSPYAFCLNNPIRFIDPDGRDVWEINSQGEIINRIRDRTQDAFYMVARDADGNYQRTFTTDAEGNRTYNSVSFEYGTVTGVRRPPVNVQNSDGSITSTRLTTFEMKGDNNATQLFEFLANPGVTTNVEWSHAKIGIERVGSNIVGTSHERSSTAVGQYLLGTGYTLREVNHNHPSGVGRPSGVVNADGTGTGDLGGAVLYHGRNRNTILNIYTHPGQYFRYNQNGLIIP